MEKVLDKYGYIYKTTNLINKKIYIGKKVGTEFDPAYYGTGIKLKTAIKEFGKRNFKIELIEWCSTNDILRQREAYWVNRYQSRNPQLGYNMKRGGETITLPEPLAKDNVILTFQIPKALHNQLKRWAEDECMSVSYLLRRIVLKEIHNYQEENK